MLLRFGSDGRQLTVNVGVPDSLHKGVGVHMLRFPITFDTRDTLPVGTPLHLSAQVWLAAQSDWIGFAVPERPVVTGVGGEFLSALVLTLSDDQLTVIEQRRAGADLMLRLEVHVLLGYDPGPTAPAAADSRGGQGEPWPTAYFQTDLNVQNGQWERLIEAAAERAVRAESTATATAPSPGVRRGRAARDGGTDSSMD
jgi:hypothetical protein